MASEQGHDPKGVPPPPAETETEAVDNGAVGGVSAPRGKKNTLEFINEAPSCSHYNRLCQLKAKCCAKIYPCRFCHDEDNDHEMDRHIVEKLQCTICQTVQEVSPKCSFCGVKFGEYACCICRLFDKYNHQFHCEKCGICRVGPKENFFHCDRCNACLHIDLIGNHKCLDNISMSPCPICQELLHTSRLGMHIPKCGHMLHQECLLTYYKQGHYQCPLCKESMEDMTSLWKEMDKVCAQVKMPDDLKDIDVEILCQDCHKECVSKYHIEGQKCQHCGSYNTTRK